MMLPPSISDVQLDQLFTQLAANGTGEIRMEQMILTLQSIEHAKKEAEMASDGHRNLGGTSTTHSF